MNFVLSTKAFFEQLHEQFMIAFGSHEHETFLYGPHAYILQCYLSLITANAVAKVPSLSCHQQIPLKTITARISFPDHAALARYHGRTSIAFLWEVKSIGSIWYGTDATESSSKLFGRHLPQINRQALSAFADPMGEHITELYAFLVCSNYFHLVRYSTPPADLLAKVKASAKHAVQAMEELENTIVADNVGTVGAEVDDDDGSNYPATGAGKKRRRFSKSGRSKPTPILLPPRQPPHPYIESADLQSHYPEVVYYAEPMFDAPAKFGDAPEAFSLRFRNALHIATASTQYAMGHDHLPDCFRADLAQDDLDDLQTKRMTGSRLVDMIKAQAAAQAQQVQEILNDTNPIDPNMPISPAFISNARPSDANPATTRSRSRANSIADEDLVEDQAGTVNQDTPNLYEGLEDVLSSVDASFDEEDMEASRNHLGDILGDYATSPPASSYHSSPGGSDDE